MNPIEEWEDAFGNSVSRTNRNDADLGSHYKYTPERYRLYKNGTRQIIHYDVDASTDLEDARTDEEDVFILTPSAGDTLTFNTAERFRYTVNYVSEVTQALAVNQSLSGNDRILVGLDTSPNGDQADGYYLEQTSSHSDTEVDLYEKRNGNVIGDKKTVTIEIGTQEFQRFQLDYNWYNVGVEEWTETFTEDNNGQTNTFIGRTSTESGDANSGPGGRGPIAGNGRIIAQVEADSSTSDLELYVGSASFTTLGGVAASVKAKGAETDAFTPSQSTDWEPVMAFRRDPTRPNVNLQFRGLDFTAGNGKSMIIACDPSNVLDTSGNTLSDSQFSRPEEHSERNSVLETTDLSTVNQFPDTSGNTQTTTANPGGYQLAFDTTRSVGTGSKQQMRSGDLEEKHGLHDGDIGVLITKPGDTTDQRYFHEVEMDE